MIQKAQVCPITTSKNCVVRHGLWQFSDTVQRLSEVHFLEIRSRPTFFPHRWGKHAAECIVHIYATVSTQPPRLGAVARAP
eukprot:4021569-Amphidinium_carterae.2